MSEEKVSPIEFGKVLGRLDAQDKHIEELKTGQREANQKLDQILQYQAKQKGAASLLVLLASTVSAVVGWIISWWTTR